MKAEGLEAARAVAYRYIGYAARSRREIEKRLERDEFTPDIIQAILAECEAQGWVDDTKFAGDWIADRADRKKYGKTRLKMELQRKGIDKDTLNEALDKVDDEDELKRALAAAQSKWRPDTFFGLPREAQQAEKTKNIQFFNAARLHMDDNQAGIGGIDVEHYLTSRGFCVEREFYN